MTETQMDMNKDNMDKDNDRMDEIGDHLQDTLAVAVWQRWMMDMGTMDMMDENMDMKDMKDTMDKDMIMVMTDMMPSLMVDLVTTYETRWLWLYDRDGTVPSWPASWNWTRRFIRLRIQKSRNTEIQKLLEFELAARLVLQIPSVVCFSKSIK